MSLPLSFDNIKVLDLTHTIHDKIPTWTGSCGFEMAVLANYSDFPGEYKLCAQGFKIKASCGTHMDAPTHFFEKAQSIDQIPVNQLICPACVIDVSAKSSETYLISEEDILIYEKNYGKIPENALVIGYTGWDKFWNDPKKYRNENTNGFLRFPSFSIEAAQLLMKRDIAGIAIDTLSPDAPENGYPVHKLFLNAGKYIIENVAHASLLPVHGAHVIVAPLKIQGATESPIRLFGLINID